MIPVIGTIVNRLRKAIAIVEDGDTASQTIAKGKYIVWKGELCQTDSAITQGGTFATSGAGKNLTAKTEGLGGEIATLNSNITPELIAKDTVNNQWEFVKVGNVFIFTISGAGGTGTIYTVAEKYRPNIIARSLVATADASIIRRCYCDGNNGNISIGNGTADSYYGEIVWTRY